MGARQLDVVGVTLHSLFQAPVRFVRQPGILERFGVSQDQTAVVAPSVNVLHFIDVIIRFRGAWHGM